ncbi:MAG: exosortase/archaeosortase family protein [Opitutae bacterium]|nr:exosortase/archaeosortase family protein [Opitutae bacterium]
MTPAAAAGASRAPLTLWIAAAGIGAALLVPLAHAWQLGTNLGHGWLAPFLAGYLWWERWTERPASQARPFPLALGVALAVLLAALLLPLRLLLTPYPLWPLGLATYALALVGGALVAAFLVAGRDGVRWLGAPLIVLVAALPWPTAIETQVILPLRQNMADLAAEICNWLDKPALAAGTSIRLGSGWVGVDEACGGIRSLQGCVLIALFLGEWFRFSPGRRVALALAAAGWAVLGNFTRVLFLALRGSPDSIQQTHDLAGWTALALSAAGTVWLASHWAGYRLPGTGKPGAQDSAAPRHADAGAAVACAFALALLAGELANFVWFHRAADSARDGWTAQFPIANPTFRKEPLADVAREMLRPDFFAAGRWRTARDEWAAAYYIEWRHGQVARFIPFLHNPTVCLPMAGCEVEEQLPTLALSFRGSTIPFHVYRFRRAEQEFLVAFAVWDPLARAPLEPALATATWREWIARLWSDVAHQRQHQPAQMLTVALPLNASASSNLENLLHAMVIPRENF